MAKKVRLEGIDFLKVFAIFGVICLHVAGSYYKVGSQDQNLELALMPIKFFYYTGTLAIPLFFCINGFLILGKAKVTSKYILRKIAMMLTPVILWAIIVSVAKLIVKKEFVNPLWAAIGYLTQQGFFFQFWFIGALVIVQLVSPLLNRLLRRHWTIFQVVTVIMGILCLVVMSFSYYVQTPLAKEVIQTFRLWTWFFYFMLGAALRRTKYLSKMSKRNRFTFFVFTIISVQIAAIFSSVILKNGYAEYDYDSIFVMLAVIILMILYSQIINLERGKVFSRLILHFSENTMGIFIVHILILKLVLRLIPTSIQSLAPLSIIIVFLASDLLVSCIEKTLFFYKLVSID